MFTELNISPVKRACIEWSGQFLDRRQTGSYRSLLLGREVGSRETGRLPPRRPNLIFLRAGVECSVWTVEI